MSTTTYGEMADGFVPSERSAAQAAIDEAARREKIARRRRNTVRVLLILLLLLIMLGIRLLPLDWNPFVGLNASAFGASGVSQGAGAGSAGGGAGSGGSGGSGAGVAAGSSSDTKGGKGGSGAAGVSAAAGSNGAPGAPGPAGANGAAGPAGANGAAGPAGAAGAAGPAGPAGPAGADGRNYGVPLGQGDINVGACDSAVNISLSSDWAGTPPSGHPLVEGLKLIQVRLYNVASTCNGQHLSLVLLTSSGRRLTSITRSAVTVTGAGEILIDYPIDSTDPALPPVASVDVSNIIVELRG
jgi:hypothetical protein